MVVVDVCDGRKVHAWDIVLHDSEVCEVRHESIDDSSERVSIMVLCRICIEVHDLLAAWTCLEKESRSHRSASLDVDHESDIVEHFPIVLPLSGHSIHAHLLSICEEHLHALLPVCALLKEMRHSLKCHTYTITVIGSTIRPYCILLRHRLRIT